MTRDTGKTYLNLLIFQQFYVIKKCICCISSSINKLSGVTFMNLVVPALQVLGPCRSSKLAEYLQEKHGKSPLAARQRISRNASAIKFPIPLLPNREQFVYLENQYKSEIFWPNFHTALRETNSIYGMAIDGLANRGGVIEASEFAVISGAPIALKKQVTVDIVAQKLQAAGIIRKVNEDGTDYYYLNKPFDLNKSFEAKSISEYQTLMLAERVLLGGIREWAKKLGLVSYHKAQIRGDKGRKVGQFMWDLTGPSYLWPLKPSLPDKSHQGFLVADVFAKGVLSKDDIKYFVRKVQLLQSSIKNIKLLPILVAEGFDRSASNYGKGIGVALASIKNLFGTEVAQGISTLIETLNNAAATAAVNPKKLIRVLNDLSKIEGAVGNLRGTFFELISVYLAKQEAKSVDHSKKFIDPETNKQIEIDVFRVIHKKKIVCIECKGKSPGGVVGIEEIDNWLKWLPKIRNHIKAQDHFKDAKVSFELWSTGTFSDKSIKKLKIEKKRRIKNPIDWKNGKAILALARKTGEQGVVDALNEHYIKHPLS